MPPRTTSAYWRADGYVSLCASCIHASILVDAPKVCLFPPPLRSHPPDNLLDPLDVIPYAANENSAAWACRRQHVSTTFLDSRLHSVQRPNPPPLSAHATRAPPGTLLGPLDGIPYAAKDNFCTLGVPTTASSDALVGFTPPYDATPVERLRQSGAPLLGKTNMDEFGMGSGTLFSSHGPTLNPWSPGKYAWSSGRYSSGPSIVPVCAKPEKLAM